jgi:hypothetical protein
VQLHQRDLNHQESILARCALDLCRAYMGDNVVSWVADSGEAMYVTVRGSDLEPIHVTVTAGKELRQQDIDRVQAQAQFLGQLGSLGLPPQVMVILMREAQFGDNIVQELATALAAAQAPPAGESVPPSQNSQPIGGGPPEFQAA